MSQLTFMKTPFERWQERTNDGHEMAAGWVSKRYDPPKHAEYEVRGNSGWSYLTWAYGYWWTQCFGDMSGAWKRIEGRYDWRGPTANYCSVCWGHVVQQAAEAGNIEAKTDLEALIKKWNQR